MVSPVDFLLRHGYALLGSLVLAEQLGAPLPAVPLLLAVGALARDGSFSFGASLALAVAASLAADFVWYILGRARGNSILKLLCRISLEPDLCVSGTKDLFGRFGGYGLLIAKFIPGFSTAAPPLAAITGMSGIRFAVLDAAGALLWSGAFLGIGYMFHRAVERVTDAVLRTGAVAASVLGGALVLYLCMKVLQRRQFLRSLRQARIAPEELREILASGQAVFIVDLRHPTELIREPATLPGALHIGPAELEERHSEIPRDREVILYCS